MATISVPLKEWGTEVTVHCENVLQTVGYPSYEFGSSAADRVSVTHVIQALAREVLHLRDRVAKLETR